MTKREYLEHATFGEDSSIKIVPDTLTDGSVTYQVEMTADGHTVTARCIDKAHASRLFAVLDECVGLDY